MHGCMRYVEVGVNPVNYGAAEAEASPIELAKCARTMDISSRALLAALAEIFRLVLYHTPIRR